MTDNVVATATAKLDQLRTELKAAFIDRDAEIDAILTALVAREHILLLGPWGTGKSAIVNALSKALGDDYFSILLTKHTAPEEVHGPWNLPALKRGRYERITKGKFPEARVAFLDEIFKSSSALLNGFLTALNERQFDNGGERVDIPLDFCVGASNELPQDEGLGALFDRFLVRRWVGYIGDRDQRRRLLLMSGEPSDKITVRLTPDELTTLQDARKSVDYTPVVEQVLDLTDSLAEAGLEVSDRRWRKVMKLIQASAILDGRDIATSADLMPLSDALWDDPEDYSKIYGLVAKSVSPDLQKALQLLDAATELWHGNNCAKADLSDGKTLAAMAQVNKSLEQIRRSAEALDQSGPVVDHTKKIQALHGSLARKLQQAVMGSW